MSNYRRSLTAGGVYFFTVVTHNRFPVFSHVKNIRAFRKICKEVCNELPFEEVACVILYDHVHSIWKLPENDCDFSKRWGVIKSRFTKYLRSNGYVEEVWQKRFWEHEIRNTNDLNIHLNYIHYNPVKHGYVKHVKDWPYSTFQIYVDKDYYPDNWGSDFVINNENGYGE